MKRIFSALGFCLFIAIPALSQAQENPTWYPGPPMITGIIGRIEWPSGNHLRLTDGRYVDLHDYTVIEPEGSKLRSGQRIAIRGFFAPGTREGHVTIDARSISLMNGDGQNH